MTTKMAALSLSLLCVCLFSACAPTHHEAANSAHGANKSVPNGNALDLMGFAKWREEQPDAAGSGLVMAANDDASRSCTVWWAGPETDFLDRMRAEARA